MNLLLLLVVSLAAVAAFVLAMYYVFPAPLLQGYIRFGGYILAGLQRKSLTVKGLHFSYYDRPPTTATHRNTTTLLFLHGLGSNKESWIRVTQYLPSSWRLLVLDMPGHGESSFDPSHNYSPIAIAKKIHMFVEALGLESFHMIGESLGALVSITYASRHPGRLTTLTTMCPPITHKLINGVKTKYIKAFEATGTFYFLFPKSADEFQHMIDVVLYNPSAFMFHHRMRQALVSWRMRHYQQFDKIQKDVRRLRIGDKAVRGLAKIVTMPVLIIWGQHDRICDPSGADTLHSLLPTSELRVLERCGHAITLERPRKCAKMTNFILEHHSVNSNVT